MSILYDGFRGIGGGENIVTEMAKTLNAPIYCCFNFTNTYNNVDVISLHQSKYKRKFFRSSPLDKYAITSDFESLELDSDVVLLAHNYCLGYCNKDVSNRIILYHHNLVLPWVFNPTSLSQKLQAGRWRRFLDKTLRRVDVHLANSEHMQKELEEYHINSKVLYPPVDTSKYTYKSDEGYYLVLARLSPELNIHEIVQLFGATGKKLLVAGSEWYKDYANKVKEMCDRSKNTEYIGEVTEEEKIDLLSRCKALINPYVQTFGITTVEALSSGKPVIGLNQGYTPYQINNWGNGVLVNSLKEIPYIIDAFERKKWDYEYIQSTAEKYDVSVFRKRLKEVVYE